MIKKHLQTLVIALACSFVAAAPLCAAEMGCKKARTFLSLLRLFLQTKKTKGVSKGLERGSGKPRKTSTNPFG